MGPEKKTIAIIGGGPAGLMAAEVLSAQGLQVSLYERKPSVGRKFLMAGRGGLNLTHSEELGIFLTRYGASAAVLSPVIHDFSPQDLRDWCEGLGQKTFIGSSGRVFPESFKASPLLRAWIARLESRGVDFKLGHDWQGWEGDALIFNTPTGPASIKPAATLLALGGASWPRLGSDGSWVDVLKAQGLSIAPLQPANCGFCVDWSPVFKGRFAGQPLKSIVASFRETRIPGEIMISDKGIEGGAIYALSSLLRDEVLRNDTAQLMIDLKPGLSLDELTARLKKPRSRLTLSSYLRKTLSLSDVAIGLLMESPERTGLGAYPADKLAALIKSYSLNIGAPFSIERSISTAGGVMFENLSPDFMLLNKPGVFIAGEMMDWEAPTGGYLLQASIATSVRAARGIISWLDGQKI